MSSDVPRALELTLTEQDVVAFTEFTYTKSRFYRRRFIRRSILSFLSPPIGVAGAALFIGGPFYAYYVEALVAAGLALSVVWGGAWWLLRLALIRYCTKRTLRNGTYEQTFKPSRIEVSQEGIACVSAMGTYTIKWPAVIDITATANAAYAYVNSLHACIFPRRAFRDDAAFEGFIQIMRQYRQKFGTAAAE